MSEAGASFGYVALDEGGRRRRGVVVARDEAGAFAALKGQGLMPVSVRPTRANSPESRGRGGGALNPRDVARLISDLAALLRAGADIRSALTIVATRNPSRALQEIVKSVSRDVSGGEAMDRVLERRLGPSYAFVAALAAAGEASGDLAGGLERGAEMLQARIALRDQLVSTLSYPTFVAVTAVVAFVVILTMVVPSVAPLAEAPGAEPSFAMRSLLGASAFLRGNGLWLLLIAGGGAAAAAFAGWTGLLSRLLDRAFIDGPWRRTSRALVYGGFAIALGGILSAGAPMGEALRLSLRAVRSDVARRRLEPISKAVRQGETLSNALGRTQGFPQPIAGLAFIGEETGALGPMLARAGRLEEEAAMKRIEAAGRMLGPLLIVVLGGLIGLMMAALLTGVSGLGDAALN
ncbi:type II secretion system F family protein [Caulobacter mirabilis]|nr:type II secretion system F family protein [Caulobacter mirabilis]